MASFPSLPWLDAAEEVKLCPSLGWINGDGFRIREGCTTRAELSPSPGNVRGHLCEPTGSEQSRVPRDQLPSAGPPLALPFALNDRPGILSG
jgi:hypothetical protein